MSERSDIADAADIASASPEVVVAGVGLWLPEQPSFAAWSAGGRDPLATSPKGDALGKIHRRRAGPLGRALSDAASEALHEAGIEMSGVPSVIGSALGEAGTLIRLLEQMWRGFEPMSPADFTLSVHNAASGVMSIAAGNRGFTTSIAADHDTPASALLEAIGLVVTEGVPVLVACGDEASPSALLSGSDAWSLMAAAVVLVPSEWAGPRRGRLRMVSPSGVRTPALADVAQDTALNPQAGMLELLAAIVRGGDHLIGLDRGAGRGFRASVRAEPKQ